MKEALDRRADFAPTDALGRSPPAFWDLLPPAACLTAHPGRPCVLGCFDAPQRAQCSVFLMSHPVLAAPCCYALLPRSAGPRPASRPARASLAPRGSSASSSDRRETYIEAHFQIHAATPASTSDFDLGMLTRSTFTQPIGCNQQGHHSADHVAKIKPAVYDMLKEKGYHFTPDVPNPGCASSTHPLSTRPVVSAWAVQHPRKRPQTVFSTSVLVPDLA